MGLRDTVAILSEAYSYLPYERRIQATYAFVLECLRGIARDRAKIVRTIDEARMRRSPCATEPWLFGVDAKLADSGPARIPKRRIDTVVVDLDPGEDGVQEGRRRVAGPIDAEAPEVTLQVAFLAERREDPGAAWVVSDPTPELLRVLEVHLGKPPRRLTSDVTAELDVFYVDEAVRRSRPFQGHRETSVTGRWERRTIVASAGDVVVSATPLVTHLLHPESDDSLTTWNFFDDRLSFDGPSEHPARRVPCESLASFGD